jgi:hypothetical protein
LDHAEAVAAKLVEVIVRDAIEISNLHGEIKQGVADWYAMKDERDTARDELAEALRELDKANNMLRVTGLFGIGPRRPPRRLAGRADQ